MNVHNVAEEIFNELNMSIGPSRRDGLQVCIFVCQNGAWVLYLFLLYTSSRDVCNQPHHSFFFRKKQSRIKMVFGLIPEEPALYRCAFLYYIVSVAITDRPRRGIG